LHACNKVAVNGLKSLLSAIILRVDTEVVSDSQTLLKILLLPLLICAHHSTILVNARANVRSTEAKESWGHRRASSNEYRQCSRTIELGIKSDAHNSAHYDQTRSHAPRRKHQHLHLATWSARPGHEAVPAITLRHSPWLGLKETSVLCMRG